MKRRKRDLPRRTLFERVKSYFGFAEPGLSGRERLRIFARNERRSWNRLMGSRRPEDACSGSSSPPES